MTPLPYWSDDVVALCILLGVLCGIYIGAVLARINSTSEFSWHDDEDEARRRLSQRTRS